MRYSIRALYYSNPTVLINGSDEHAGGITATASNIAISWVTISTHTLGAAGLGYVGSAGSHVDAADGSVSWGVIAHELGHNFGLNHANRFSSRSERPNSDEGESHDYGNPFAVMGSGGGHMTLPAKVAMRANGFGYRIGTSSGGCGEPLDSLICSLLCCESERAMPKITIPFGFTVTTTILFQHLMRCF